MAEDIVRACIKVLEELCRGHKGTGLAALTEVILRQPMVRLEGVYQLCPEADQGLGTCECPLQMMVHRCLIRVITIYFSECMSRWLE